MFHVLRSLALLVVFAGSAWTQTGTDLSGSWTLDESRSAAPKVPIQWTGDGPPPPPPPPRPIAVKISAADNAFLIERTLSSAGNVSTSGVTYRLDGSETTSRMGPIVSTATASWDGHELVVSIVQTAAADTGPRAGQVIGNLQERFALENGRLIVRHMGRLAGGESSGRMVYKRAQ